MPFRYRLENILKMRIRKKEAQETVVQKAQHEVFLAEERIRQNQAEIQQTVINRKSADFRMMEYYDNYLRLNGNNYTYKILSIFVILY